MAMTKTLLLFDIDGTLLTTQGVGVAAMRKVLRGLFGESFTLEGVQVSGHLDPLIFAEMAAINGLEVSEANHGAFREGYVAQLKADLGANGDRVTVPAGIREILPILSGRDDVVMGLLTGNYTEAVPIKLGAAGIDRGVFRVTAFGDEGPTRADLVGVAMRKYEAMTGERAEPKRVVVIGDTPRDVGCAKANGCVSFAVATGKFGVEELDEAGADVVVRDFGDPGPLIELIDGY